MINFVQETEGFLNKIAILTKDASDFLFEVTFLKGQSLSEQVTEKGDESDDSTQSDSRAGVRVRRSKNILSSRAFLH